MRDEFSVEAIQEAIKVGVSRGLFPKESSIKSYLRNWETVNLMVLAAAKQNKLDNKGE